MSAQTFDVNAHTTHPKGDFQDVKGFRKYSSLFTILLPYICLLVWIRWDFEIWKNVAQMVPDGLILGMTGFIFITGMLSYSFVADLFKDLGDANKTINFLTGRYMDQEIVDREMTALAHAVHVISEKEVKPKGIDRAKADLDIAKKEISDAEVQFEDGKKFFSRLGFKVRPRPQSYLPSTHKV